MIVRIKDSISEDEIPIRLSSAKCYKVIGIEADYFRLLDDDSDPVLHEQDLFSVVCAKEPADWISEFGEDGERYANPGGFHEVGFWEDYHDGVPDVVEQVKNYLEQTGPYSWPAEARSA